MSSSSNQLLLESGPKGTETYRLVHESGAEVTFAKHGGHLLSWKTADGQERFYLSETAEYAPGKAIRGGVPIIFPQFSDHGQMGRHGFARKSQWEANLEKGLMVLQTSASSQTDWPYQTKLEVEVELESSALQIQMTVHNLSATAFEFHAALHTYLRVNDVEKAEVQGLAGMEFANEVTKQRETSPDEAITFGEEIDRGYFGVGSGEIVLVDGETKLHIESTNFPDTVVWNPGPNHGIGDMPQEDWRHFVCIEPAQVENRRLLAPGESWTGTQTIECLTQSRGDAEL